MVYLTGDCHGNFSKIYKFTAQNVNLSKDDFLIILGDFGGIWNKEENEKEKLEFEKLSSLPFNILFIDGNHENFDRLYNFPIKDMYGGKVHVIRKNIFHLIRGEVYEIDNKKFFCFGGASSHDAEYILDIKSPLFKPQYQILVENNVRFRIKNISWWEKELPNKEEYENGLKNLEKHNFTVDYILTHSPSKTLLDINKFKKEYKRDELTIYIDEILSKTNYKKWFFGHLHKDEKFDIQKGTCIYKNIELIN